MTILALQTRALSKCFGGFVATDNVSLDVRAGARHALIGPNGAGKTTLINLLTGFLTPGVGDVILAGKTITGLAQHHRARCALVRTFQINQLFSEMTVFESILMAVIDRAGLGVRWWQAVASHAQAIDEAAGIVDMLRLTELANVRTAELAYGKQRLLEIGLALAMKPSVLLLDEPAAGVPTGESRELFELIGALPKEVTVLLVEHDMDLVFRFADRISVLVNGAVLVEGDPDAIAVHPLVREVYLGESSHV